MSELLNQPLSRRTAVGALGATTALAACARLPLETAASSPAGNPTTTNPPTGNPTTANPPTTGAQALLDDIAWNLLRHQPSRATGLGVDTGPNAWLRGEMGDDSPSGRAALIATLRSDLARARAFPREGIAPETATSFAVVQSAYSAALDGLALPYGDIPIGSWRAAPYAVIQNAGAYLDLPRFFDTDQPLREPADVDAYLARLAQVPAVLDAERARITAAREMGVVPPDFLLDKAMPQLESTLADAAGGGSFVSALLRADLPAAPAAARDAGRIARQQIVPALSRQLEELRRQRAVAASDPGMAARPHGDEWYRWSLRSSTTTALAPAEIHALGRDTLADIHAQMDQLLRSIGYTEGEPGTRMIALAGDPRYRFAEGDPGRAEIIAFIEERIGWIRAQMPRAFARTVPARLEVLRLPLSEEPGAPVAYGGGGSKDGLIPGRMWINLLTTDLHRRFDLPTLVHHETIPGHVWEQEFSNQLPLIRSILSFNAYSEGWALYAEQLADELGAYTGNPAWRLGYLQDQAYRAVRLVVDTGLHTMGWPRAQAKEFFQRNVGKDETETGNEIDRYCSWPGQACGYMIGKLEILRQRERVQAALGARYDVRGFNQAVVDGGNVPLDVLEQNVTRYLAGAAA